MQIYFANNNYTLKNAITLLAIIPQLEIKKGSFECICYYFLQSEVF